MDRKILISALLLAVLLLPVTAKDPALIKTNVEFLTEVINREVRGEIEYLALNEVKVLQIDTVYLKSLKPHPGNWLVESVLLDILRAKKVAVVLDPKVPRPTADPAEGPAAPPDSGRADTAAAATVEDSNPVKAPEKASGATDKKFILEYRVVECFLMYKKIGRVGLIGKKEIERYAKASGLLRLVDQRSQAVVWTRKFTQAQSDIIPYSSRDLVENPLYNFRKEGQVKPYWKELLEISLAGGSVGYLLYLFFSQSFN